MTAEQLLTAGRSTTGESRGKPSEMVEVIRASFAATEPHADELTRHFYATLFTMAPEIRELFPAHMQVQRSRLLRALVHIVQMVDKPKKLLLFLEQLGRDHRKFGVLAEHYDVFGTALLSTIGMFAGSAWTPVAEQAWNDAYTIVAGAMRTGAQGERGSTSWSGRVLEHKRIGRDIATITLQTSDAIPYRAGQYLSVEIPQRPRLWRYLSPANAPRPDGVLEFHVRAVPDGWVSPAIVAHSRIGDTWRIGPPMGRMHVESGTGRELLMVAGGTGMAPMKALLGDLARRPEQPRTQVFVGGRSWDDLYDFASIRKLSYSNTWLDVIPVVERDDVASGAEIGTLADVVTRYGAWADHETLVCGSPSMIRATVSRMLVAGTPLDRIRYDPFTMD